MGRWTLLALGVLALTLTAADCGARKGPVATPAPAESAASPATLIAFIMVSASSLVPPGARVG